MKYTNIIYGLKDPRNDVYRYIGKTTIGEGRPLSHLKKSHNIFVNQWVEELRINNLSPIVDVIESDIPLDQLSDKEKHYIVYYSSTSGQLFNGGETLLKTISKPSILSESDINSLYISLLNTRELYKLFKSFTNFNDTVIGNILGVQRKTVHSIKTGNLKISTETIFKLIFFIKKGIRPVFDYYYSSSNEFQGKHPDTYEDFIKECVADKSFCTKWFSSFYKSVTNEDRNFYK